MSIYTFGDAVQSALSGIGVYCPLLSDAAAYARYERYLDETESLDAPATRGKLRAFLYRLYDIPDAPESDDTVLTSETAPQVLKEETDAIIARVFQNPTNLFRVHPMEHELSEDNSRTDAFLTETGAGGAVINSPWKDGWNQNPENLEKLIQTARMLKERRLHSWLYDEVVYPSGWANGFIDTPDDRYIAQNIGIAIISGTDTARVTVGLPSYGMYFLKAYLYDYSGREIHFDTAEEVAVEEKSVTFTGREGAWISLSFFVRQGNIWPYKWAKTLSAPIGPRKLPNLMNADAVAKFLDGSLEPVVKAAGGDPRELFEAVFTDEPALRCYYQQGEKRRPSYESVPYGNELFAYFEEKNGFDLREKLPFLFFGDSDEALRVRVRFWEAVADLTAKNFTGQYRERCQKYGLHFSGHLLGEETLMEQTLNYGNYMQAVGQMHYPGFDMTGGRNDWFWQRGTTDSQSGLYTGAQSKLDGHNTTMVEVCPVGGQGHFLTDTINHFEQLMTSVIFTGATHVNTYGYRFLNKNDQFNHLNDYVGRLCLFARMSVSDAKLAVYYPVEDLQAHIRENTVEMFDFAPEVTALNTYVESLYYCLFSNRLDFNIVTRQGLEKARLAQGELRICTQGYRAVLVPPMEIISGKSLRVLKAFAENGGTVIFLERLPRLTVEGDAVEPLPAGMEVFSPGLENKAVHARVSATHTAKGYSTEPVTDGSSATSQCFDGWSSEILPASLTVDLGLEKTFNHAELYSTGGHEQTGYKLEALVGGQWKPLCGETGNECPRMDGDFADVTARFVRLVYEVGCKTDPQIARLNEFQLYQLIHSDVDHPFTARLKALCGSGLAVSGEKPDTLRQRLLCVNGRRTYFLVNISFDAQTVFLRAENGKSLRLSDPMTGEVTENAQSVTIEGGRGVFLTES